MFSGVFAKAGVTIPAGGCWAFTGVMGGTIGGVDEPYAWEVELAPVGGIAHGFATTGDITESAVTLASDVRLALGVPEILTVDSACTRGQPLAVGTGGLLTPRTNFAAIAALAVKDAGGAGPVSAIPLITTFRTPARATPTTSAPAINGAPTDGTLVPEMSVSLSLRLGTGVAVICTATIDKQPGDDALLSLWCTPAGGAAVKLFERSAENEALNLGDDKESCVLSTHIPISAIPTPTAASHTFELRARDIAGQVRFVALERTLIVVEG